MATLDPTTSPSRRSLFGATGAMLLLAAPAAGAAKAQELDDELLAACAQYQALEAQYQRLARVSAQGWDAEHPAAEAGLDAMADEYEDAIHSMARLPARTPEGLQAKAAAIMGFHGNSAKGYGSDYPHQRLEWSLFMDVAGRT